MPPSSHRRLLEWVEHYAAHTEAANVEWCDGSAAEYERLCALLVANGTFARLSDAKRPNSYWAHSDPKDVARVESRTFICSEDEQDAEADELLVSPGGDEGDAHVALQGIDAGSDDVRRAVLDGPGRGSPFAKHAVQLTDSPYVAVSMRIMTRMENVGARGHGRRRRVRRRASIRSVFRSSSGRPTSRGPVTPRTSTSPTSPRPARSGPLGPGTGATRCSERSALRCASHRSSLATRVGSRSTCSSPS